MNRRSLSLQLRCRAAAITIGISAWAAPAAFVSNVHAAGATNPLEGRADVTDEGRSLFNQYCSHCHGPNAVQGERPRDLRRLKIRYGNDATDVFYTTVSTGIADKGMPVWKGVLSDDVLWQIYTYLQSVQAQP